jgi:hypothetical protein
VNLNPFKRPTTTTVVEDTADAVIADACCVVDDAEDATLTALSHEQVYAQGKPSFPRMLDAAGYRNALVARDYAGADVIRDAVRAAYLDRAARYRAAYEAVTGTEFDPCIC